MNYNIIIALVGALINAMLSVVVPCMFKKTNEPLVNDIKKLYRAKRELILSSSIIIGITIYLALELAPELRNLYLNLNANKYIDESDFRLTNLINSQPIEMRPDIRNLIRLM